MGSDLLSLETGNAFFDGAIPEYESIKRIGTGNAKPQDAMLLLYLLHIKDPTKAPSKEPTKIEEEPVKNNNLAEPEPVKQKGDGEAFEAEKPKLLDKEGDVSTYKSLIDNGKRGDNITPHHMPSAKWLETNTNIKYNDGICLNMEQPSPGVGGRHRKTSTYDNNMTKAEQQAYLEMKPREALAKDILDAKKIYQEQGLYNQKIRDGLQEVIKQNKINYPELYKK